MSTLHLRLDTVSLAQLKIIRSAWAKLPTANHDALVAAAESNAAAAWNGPLLALALPQSCSPAASSRYAALAYAWQSLSDTMRSELLDEVITLRDSKVAKAGR